MKMYPNPMMPQRGGWWPDCLGVIAIGMISVGGSLLAGVLIVKGLM